ncbi:MAG: VanW family protein [Frankiaceae bacterium]|nr:VanW family protein [Frankiaceae bacterium]
MRRLTLLLGALVAVVLIGYAASFLLYGDNVPRGVHVRGIDLSGRSPAQATTILADRLAGVAGAPLVLVADDVRSELVPARVGLRIDLDATVDEAHSAGPLDRLRGLLGARRDVEPVPVVHEDLLAAALQHVADEVERDLREGSVTFTGTTPVAVEPLAGRSLDVAGAIEAIRDGYLDNGEIEVPVDLTESKSSSDDIAEAMDAAEVAISAPVTIDVEGKPLELSPADVARGLTFVASEDGPLEPRVDAEKVLDGLGRRLEAVEQLPVDATFKVASGKPVLVPSREGRTVPPEELSSALLDVVDDDAPRRASVSLKVTAPRVTTEKARTLGVKEVIGTFTTRHPCCAPRVTNIHTIADIVDGYVVLPGETFSLNGVVGKRDTARGFVQAPQILRGQFVKDVGGGVSQFATTIFNAVFFSGLKDVQHTPHSYYISRYPPGRESTVSFPEPDFRFMNDAPTGVLITTSYTSRSITVTFWGTKRYDIDSVTGPRTRVRPFGKEYVDRPDCTPASGAEGFDIVVTRIFKDLTGTVLRREPFKTRYLPEPNFICGPPPPGQPAKQPPPASG